MNSRKRTNIKALKINQLLSVGFIVLGILLVVSWIGISDSFKDFYIEDSKEDLLVTSTILGNNFEDLFQRNLEILFSIEKSFEETPTVVGEDFERFIQDERQMHKVLDIGFVSEDGSTVTDHFKAEGFDYSKAPVFTFTISQTDTGEEFLYQTLKLRQPFEYNGKNYSKLFALFSLNEVKRYISSTEFKNNSEVFLVSADGTIVLDLNNAVLADQHFGFVPSEIVKTEDKLVELLTVNEIEIMCAVSPILEKTWYSVVIIPYNILIAQVSTYFSVGLFLCIFFALGITILSIANNRLQMLIQKETASHYEKEQNLIKASAEQFRIGFQYSNKGLVSYHLKTGELIFPPEFIEKYGLENLKNIKDFHYLEDRVQGQSIEELRAFRSHIEEGSVPCSCEISLADKHGRTVLYHLDCNILPNVTGLGPVAVIVTEDISIQREEELIFERWNQELKTIKNMSTSFIEANLSENIVEGLSSESAISEETRSIKHYSELVTFLAPRAVFDSDRELFLNCMDRERLIGQFSSGTNNVEFEFRFALPESQHRWMRASIRLVFNPITKDIKAYMSLIDIDKEKRLELEKIRLSQEDSLTGAINKAEFASRVTKILEQSNGTTQHYLLFLDIDGFKLVNDFLGHSVGDETLKELVGFMRSVLDGENDFVGRVGGDEFMIFLGNISFDAIAGSKAEEICNILRRELSSHLRISASIGISVFPRDGNTFQELYAKSDKALYRAKLNGKDSYSFYDPSFEDSKTKPRVLVVDDDEISRSIMTEILKADYNVIPASDGRQALSYLRRFGTGISAVLLDLIMPVMNGYEVLDSISEDILLSSIPIIVVSAEDKQKNGIQTLEAGAADFIAKPIDPSLLLLKLRNAIQRSENERKRAQIGFSIIQHDEKIKYRFLTESTGTAVVEMDLANHIYRYDEQISKLLSGTFDNRPLWAVLKETNEEEEVEKIRQMVLSLDRAHRAWQDKQTFLLTSKEGEKRWFSIKGFSETQASKIVLTVNDVNEETLSENRLHFMAERDTLTGLYNRQLFSEKASSFLRRQPLGNWLVQVLDIDNFKVINDLFGFQEGDKVLKALGKKLEEDMDGPNKGLLSRITDDTFARVVPNTGEQIKKINDDYWFNYPLSSRITVCSGLYEVNDYSVAMDAIVDRAMIALESIKGRKDHHVAFFDETMRQRILNTQELSVSLDAALDGHEFEVWFQPIHNLQSDMPASAEALVRWRHPTKGLIPPAQFIPTFEKDGSISKVDHYVWEEVFKYQKTRIDRNLPRLPISVNASRVSLFNPNIGLELLELSHKYSVSPDLIKIEVTESAYMDYPELLCGIVSNLQKSGFTVLMDDFGSGYSSMNMLKDIPVNILKVDMRFLQGFEKGGRVGTIFTSILRMAKWLEIPVVAEGVETADQTAFLKSMGCEFIQGYFFSRPLQVSDFEQYLKGFKAVGEKDIGLTDTTSDVDSLLGGNLLFNKMIDSLVGCFALFEIKGDKIDLVRANENFCALMGCEIHNVYQNSALLEQSMGPSEYESLKQNMLTSTKTGESVSGTLHCKSYSDNSLLTINYNCRLLGSTSDSSFVGMSFFDLTSLVNSRDNLQRTSSQLNSIVENTDNGIFRIRRSENGLKLVFANNAMYTLFKIDKDSDLEGVHLRLKDFLGDSWQKRYEDILNLNKNSNLSRTQFVKRKDFNGKKVCYKFFTKVVSQDNENEIICIVSDVTSMVNFED